MSDAHEVAVRAVAAALCGAPSGERCSAHRADATSALAALNTPEVRAALAVVPCLTHPGMDGCGGATRGANLRLHPACVLVALAGMVPPPL